MLFEQDIWTYGSYVFKVPKVHVSQSAQHDQPWSSTVLGCPSVSPSRPSLICHVHRPAGCDVNSDIWPSPLHPTPHVHTWTVITENCPLRYSPFLFKRHSAPSLYSKFSRAGKSKRSYSKTGLLPCISHVRRDSSRRALWTNCLLNKNGL